MVNSIFSTEVNNLNDVLMLKNIHNNDLLKEQFLSNNAEYINNNELLQ